MQVHHEHPLREHNFHKSLCVLLVVLLGLWGVLDVVFYNLPLHHKSCPRDADDMIANSASKLLAAFWLTFTLHIAIFIIWATAANATTSEDWRAIWDPDNGQNENPQRT